jgi:hypothetical protein
MTTVKIDLDTLTRLDLSPVEAVIQTGEAELEQKIQFEIAFPREETDPRELSEIPEVRLWFVRLDGKYPQMPFFLDWKAGELVRYTAMLVPHQFNRSEGILFNPEALEIFVMQKVFVLTDWLKKQDLPYASRLKAMTQLFGYEIDEGFFEQL